MKLVKSGLAVPDHVADAANKPFQPKEETWTAKDMARLDKAFAFLREHAIRVVLICETCNDNRIKNPQLAIMPLTQGNGAMAMCACTKRLWKLPS